MDSLLKYVVEEGLIMIVALYVLAEVIKRTELVDKRFLPVILMLVSALMTPLLMGGYNAYNIVQSLLVTGGAVLAYETKKETIEGGE